jgi:large subunit ribosomal protein L5
MKTSLLFDTKELNKLLAEGLGRSNPMSLPKIKKITINMGVGAASQDKKALDGAVSDLGLISGQKPMVTNARKSVASFKIREGWPIGCKVTLRGKRMNDFLVRLINIAIPRIRDFRGLSPKSFDGFGNYTFGLKEQIVFPEINYDAVDRLRGMDITVTTSTKCDKEALLLLKTLGFPIRGN